MIVPQGWRVTELGELVKFISGGTPSRSCGEYWNGDVPWFSAKDLKRLRLTTSIEPITKLGSENGTRLVSAGTVLVLVRGMTLMKDFPVGITTRKSAFNQDLKALQHDPGELDGAYLAYVLVNDKRRMMSYVNQAGHGTGRLATEYLEAHPVSVPPLVEQKRIAEILGAWDEAIEKVGKLIEAKQKLKRGLMQQLLTGHRALTTAAAQRWERARLSDLFEPVTREVGKHKTTVLSITATVGFVDQAAKFSRVIAGEQLTKYVLLKRGEFSYNKGNSNAYPQGCIYMLEEFDEGAVPHVYISFRAKDPTTRPEFYKHFFAAGGLNRQLHRLINSGVRNDGLLNLDEADFFAMQVPKPEPAEQKRIANMFTELDTELKLLKAQEGSLTTQKRGLMQKLLTGEIRVEVGAVSREVTHAR